MKKVLAVMIVIVMSLGLFAACGSSGDAGQQYHVDIAPYDQMDFSEYVKVPSDLSGYEYKVEKIEVKDSDVDSEIQRRLESAAEDTEVTEGKVEKGDKVKISFKGTLKDGSSPEGMNSDGTELTLGEGGYIDGFEEGIYGAKIGDTVTLDLQFPDPYPNNTDLAGQDVTFEVTVLAKIESKVPELNEEFIKKDSQENATTEEEYRDYILKTLQEQADNQAEYNAKQSLYQAILADCEVIKYPEEEVEAQKTALIDQYKSYAESQQMEWEDFLKTNFKDEDTFNTQLDSYVREALVGLKLKVYALCKQEGIELTDEEFTTEIQSMLEAYGVKDGEEFQTKYGTSLEEYLKAYDVTLNMYVSKLIDKVAGVEAEAEE